MKKLLPFILLLISVSSFSQNYQTVNSDRTAFFGNLFCVKIDSVRFNGDSILYPFTQIRQITKDRCYSPYQPSWIGFKIIIKNNGENIFFNKDSDQIVIKTQAKLGDKWFAFQKKDSISIEAKVTSFDTVRIIGLLDSVKTISLLAFDKNKDTLKNMFVNVMQIMISKNYGFIFPLDFYTFPYYERPETGYYRIFNFLVGLSNPKVGIQNLTWFDIYNYQPGDELDIIEESSDYGSLRASNQYKKSEIKFTYLDRTDYKDSIVYNVSVEKFTKEGESPFDNLTSIYKKYTTKEKITQDSRFDKLPDEPVITEYSAYSIDMFQYYDGSNTYSCKVDPYTSFHKGGDCWVMPIYDGCFPADTFKQGLGGPYYHCDNAFSMGGSDRHLVYYKKGSKTWGTPLVLTDVKSTYFATKISVYPIPAKDYVTVKINEFNSPVIFEIIDINGRTILTRRIRSDETRIDIKSISPGVYLYKLLNKGKTIKSDKLSVL